MESETESLKSHTESEEDFGCYFLQPASSPYNIAEKVQQANVDLLNSNSYANNDKRAKVKFREELVSFEPDSTDDDVNSIESDQVEVFMDTRPSVLEFKTTVNSDVNIFNIEEEIVEIEEEEIVEDIESDCDVGIKNIEHSHKYELKNITSNTEENNAGYNNNTATDSSSKRCNKRKTINKHKSAFLNPHVVHCKDHCIDKFDFDLSMSIKKLDIHEKVNLPPLQLLQRKCCDELNQKIHKNLPNYNGLRSEYGLTSRQLKMREKQTELIKLREQMSRQLSEEYKTRKMQQNEEVFVQWLKEVSRRKSEKKNASQQKVASAKQRFDRTTSIFPNNSNNKKTKQRPKTAKEFRQKAYEKKQQRPHTTHSCVYIEIPQSLLEQGLSIGDLTITNSKLLAKKLHIFTVS